MWTTERSLGFCSDIAWNTVAKLRLALWASKTLRCPHSSRQMVLSPMYNYQSIPTLFHHIPTHHLPDTNSLCFLPFFNSKADHYSQPCRGLAPFVQGVQRPHSCTISTNTGWICTIPPSVPTSRWHWQSPRITEVYLLWESIVYFVQHFFLSDPKPFSIR